MTSLTAYSHTSSNRNISTFAAKYYLVLYSSYFIIIIIINAERVTGPGRKLPLLQLFSK